MGPVLPQSELSCTNEMVLDKSSAFLGKNLSVISLSEFDKETLVSNL